MKKLLMCLFVLVLAVSLFACDESTDRDDKNTDTKADSETESVLQGDDNVCGDTPAQLGFSSFELMAEFVSLLGEDTDIVEDFYDFHYMGGVWPESYSREELRDMWNTVKDVALPYVTGMNEDDYDVIYFPESRNVKIEYIFSGLKTEFLVSLDEAVTDEALALDSEYEYVCDITVTGAPVRIYDTGNETAKALLTGKTVIDGRLTNVILRTSNIPNVTEYVPAFNEIKTLGEIVSEYADEVDSPENPEIYFAHLPDLSEFAECRGFDDEEFYNVVLRRATEPGCEWPFFTKDEFSRMWEKSSELTVPYVEGLGYSFMEFAYDISDDFSDELRFIYDDGTRISITVYTDAAMVEENEFSFDGDEYAGSLDVGGQMVGFFDVDPNPDEEVYCGVVELDRIVKIEIYPRGGDFDELGYLKFDTIKFADFAEMYNE